jgi:hypothetical protein
MPTDRQTQDYLLCKQCEGILNRGGENWLANKLATWERTFPLYDLLTKVPPCFSEEDGATVYFTANNHEFRAECLINFAVGIFWKASAHSWSGTETKPLIELGPYSEAIRRWLRDEAAFPSGVYLNVALSLPNRAQISFNAPHEGDRLRWHSFSFYIPGILFTLGVGKTVDEPLRILCIQNNPEHPVIVSNLLTDTVERLFATEFRNSRKTHAFVETMKKVSPTHN